MTITTIIAGGSEHYALDLCTPRHLFEIEPQHIEALAIAAWAAVEAQDVLDAYAARRALRAALAPFAPLFVPTAGTPGGLVRPQPAGQEAVSPTCDIGGCDCSARLYAVGVRPSFPLLLCEAHAAELEARPA